MLAKNNIKLAQTGSTASVLFVLKKNQQLYTLHLQSHAKRSLWTKLVSDLTYGRIYRLVRQNSRFSSSDASSVYSKIKIKSSEEDTASATSHQRHYRFIKVSHRFCNAHNTLLRTMDDTKSSVKTIFVFINPNVITVLSDAPKQHTGSVQKVLLLLSSANTTFKQKLSNFFTIPIHNLCHLIHSK